MAAMFVAKRSLFNLSKAKTRTHNSPSITISRATLSSAFEHAEGANAVAQSRDAGDQTSGMSGKAKETMREGLHEAREQARDMPSGTSDDTEGGVTGFAADKVKEGAAKAVEMAENVGDTAKETMDGAWAATKETTQNIREAATGPAESNEDVIDLQDFRNKVDNQKNRGGGYGRGA